MTARLTAVILAAALVTALPFLLRRPADLGDWRTGDPVLVIVSPHNEAIRHEFGLGFSRWHHEQYGTPVRVDWRAIGGTSEIMRYLAGEMVAAYRGWRRREGLDWPPGAADNVLDRRFDPDAPPADPAERPAWEQRRDVWRRFRETDAADAFSSGIDLLFGGGTYDHGIAAAQGLSVPPWPPGEPPPGLFDDGEGRTWIPETRGGEIWRDETFFGTALSTFGICYNPDRLRDLGIAQPPRHWADLEDPRYAGHLGIADPTKSGSIAKAFEMIVHQACADAVAAAGFDAEAIAHYEQQIARGGDPRARQVADVPDAYMQAVAEGWRRGMLRVQRIGANARYFTDAAGKVPLDVSTGAAAAGIAIDFYGRYQAEVSRAPDGTPRMVYLTPQAGSSVSADPISLLRGAPNRELALRFLRYVLDLPGQQLWNYRPGEPGGPRRFALRRLPIHRAFYPADDPVIEGASRLHARHTRDPLRDPDVDPYRLSEAFVYRPRWTGGHFSVQRDLVRAMCLDAGDELRAAWRAITAAGGPAANPEAMRLLARLPDVPEPIDWHNAPDLVRRHARMDYLRAWTRFFRQSYREARDAAGSD